MCLTHVSERLAFAISLRLGCVQQAAEAKKAVLAQLTRKLRVAVHQRLRAEDPNFAGRPEGLTDAQVRALLAGVGASPWVSKRC